MAPSMENICIDVGAKTKAEILEMGIHVGCVATYQDEFSELNNNFYCGRALDNRMGGYCIAEVARMLKEKKKNYHSLCTSSILCRKKLA